MNGKKAKALRSQTNPHPGRKSGGNPEIEKDKVGNGSRARVREMRRQGFIQRGRTNGMSEGGHGGD